MPAGLKLLENFMWYALPRQAELPGFIARGASLGTAPCEPQYPPHVQESIALRPSQKSQCLSAWGTFGVENAKLRKPWETGFVEDAHAN